MTTFADTHPGGLTTGRAHELRRRRAAVVLHLLPRLREPVAGRPVTAATLSHIESLPEDAVTAHAVDAWTSPLAPRTRYAP